MRNVAPRSATRDIRAVSLPRWAQWSLLSLALAFLLVVAVLLGLLKEDVAAAFLAIVVTCTVANFLVRRVRAASAGAGLSST